MKAKKIIYIIVTALFSLNMLLSAGMYFFNHDMVAEMFNSIGYPTYIIYPLAVAKILGLLAIWTNKSKTLKEWAYAGFVFELLLAISGHIAAEDNQFFAALVALIMVGTSYTLFKSMERTKSPVTQA